MPDKEMFAMELLPFAIKLEKMGLHPIVGVYNYPTQGSGEFECYVLFEDTVKTVDKILQLPGHSHYSIGDYIQSVDDSWAISKIDDNSSTLSLSKRFHVGVINHILTKN